MTNLALSTDVIRVGKASALAIGALEALGSNLLASLLPLVTGNLVLGGLLNALHTIHVSPSSKDGVTGLDLLVQKEHHRQHCPTNHISLASRIDPSSKRYPYLVVGVVVDFASRSSDTPVVAVAVVAGAVLVEVGRAKEKHVSVSWVLDNHSLVLPRNLHDGKGHKGRDDLNNGELHVDWFL